MQEVIIEKALATHEGRGQPRDDPIKNAIDHALGGAGQGRHPRGQQIHSAVVVEDPHRCIHTGLARTHQADEFGSQARQTMDHGSHASAPTALVQPCSA